jgi:2-polyprenyl-3-methyl-5-hydroxy-6-metoxy-1,4-benzoquinol methylase
MIEFLIDGKKEFLGPSETYDTTPNECYRDAAKEKVEEILSQMQAGVPWDQAVKKTFAKENPWLSEIVTHPNRIKFFEQKLPAKHEEILDIGAGWGQFSLPLAKTNKVCSLEPTPERMSFIHAAAKQEKIEKNMCFLGADYMNVTFKSQFDLILCIGVLEWVGVFRNDNPPKQSQQMFLEKINGELRSGGRLLIGIENRLGLKYILGNRDDHTGLADISCYHQSLAERLFEEETGRELRCFTYSMEEYRTMLLEAGFKNIVFHAAFPDYKLPQVILPASNCDSVNQFFLSGKFVEEHDGCEGFKLSQQEKIKSHYISLAQAGIAHHFAPSFFIECS